MTARSKRTPVVILGNCQMILFLEDNILSYVKKENARILP